MQKWILKLPFGKWAYRQYIAFKVKRDFRDSPSWWEKRYANGGHSGAGSRGKLAEFKIRTVNEIIRQMELTSVTELGSGDGFIAGKIRAQVYCGYDISPSSVKLCSELTKAQPSHSFHLYEPGITIVPKAALTLSQDVIFHLVEDEIFDQYMKDLFHASEKYVLIYSSNHDEPAFGWVRHRKFTSWVEKNAPGFSLLKKISNPWPFDGKDVEQTSPSDYYLYQKN